MGKEMIFFGVLGVLVGVGIFWVNRSWIAVVPVLVGLALIIFNNPGDEIERVNKELENSEDKI